MLYDHDSRPDIACGEKYGGNIYYYFFLNPEYFLLHIYWITSEMIWQIKGAQLDKDPKLFSAKTYYRSAALMSILAHWSFVLFSPFEACKNAI